MTVKSIAVLIVAVLLFPFNAMSENYPCQRKKVALVMSGGGAKGMAYVGALKVIEQAGIPIDYVVGTSMGAIIGGLYSIGYTPEQLDTLVRNQDWNFLLSDRLARKRQTLSQRENEGKYVITMPFSKDVRRIMETGVIKGENLDNTFSSLTSAYSDSINFNSLPHPFACVATDLVSGNEVVLNKGILRKAMRASMAIPGVFTPVELDSMLLVDGGLLNNYPADVAKAMGADIILGLSVQQDLKSRKELMSMVNVIKQVVDLACRNKYEENKKLSDVFIQINTEGYTSASFSKSAVDSLITIGEECAKKQMEELYALKEKIGVGRNFHPKEQTGYRNIHSGETIKIAKINFPDEERKYVRRSFRRSGITVGKSICTSLIDSTVAQIRENLPNTEIGYGIAKTDSGSLVTLHLDHKNEDRLNIGLRFDSEEIAALIANARIKTKTTLPSYIDITGRLGKRYAAKLSYIVSPTAKKNLDLAYTYNYNDINIYHKGSRSYNSTYNQHTLRLKYSDEWIRNFRYAVGIYATLYNYDDLLYANDGSVEIPSKEHFINYYAGIEYNSFDNPNYPKKGTEFSVSYTVYTDNFTNHNGTVPFSALAGTWTRVIPLSSHFFILPSVYGRALIGRNISIIYQNAIGGTFPAHYLPQQQPFAGVNYVEFVERNFIATSWKFRYRVVKEHYVTLETDFAANAEKLENLLKKKILTGFSIGYGFNSKIGPMELSLGYSTHTSKVKSFVNLGYYF